MTHATSEVRRFSTRTSFGPEAYSGLPIEFALMPVRCYSCGKIMDQLGIEEALDEGKNIKTIMDEMGYIRICCRRTVMTAVPVVARLKQIDHQNRTIASLSQLSVHETGVPESYVRIIDEVPPGAVLPSSSVCLPSESISILEPTGSVAGTTTEATGINPFEYYMNQIVEEAEGEE